MTLVVFSQTEDMGHGQRLIFVRKGPAPASVELLKLAGDEAQLEIFSSSTEGLKSQRNPTALGLHSPVLHEIASLAMKVGRSQSDGDSV